MAQKVTNDIFRSTFKTISKDSLTWFPGHMGKGLKQMQHKIKSVDCIIQVHDARIPFSGRNEDFKYKISGIHPHILVMNKKDLIDKKLIPILSERLKSSYSHVIFTNCKDQNCKGVQRIFPLAKELISKSNRYNRTGNEDYNMMIIGIPNVGKSSLINSLRHRHLKRGNATPVGATAGVTKSVMHRIKLSDDPLFYMLDTPGILSPQIGSTEIGLKLALCATILDHIVGNTIIADYLLFWLNKQKLFSYVKTFDMDGPNDNILEVLTRIALNNKKMLRIRDTSNMYIYRPDIESAANIMIGAFRNGQLGPIMLDQDLL